MVCVHLYVSTCICKYSCMRVYMSVWCMHLFVHVNPHIRACVYGCFLI